MTVFELSYQERDGRRRAEQYWSEAAGERRSKSGGILIGGIPLKPDR
jgi:hypothetical protein